MREKYGKRDSRVGIMWDEREMWEERPGVNRNYVGWEKNLGRGEKVTIE